MMEKKFPNWVINFFCFAIPLFVEVKERVSVKKSETMQA
jgi:hypothetical protein